MSDRSDDDKHGEPAFTRRGTEDCPECRAPFGTRHRDGCSGQFHELAVGTAHPPNVGDTPPDLPGLFSAIDSARTIMALSSRDWGKANDSAWLWGLLLGWGPDDTDPEDTKGSWDEMADRYGWDSATLDRLRTLHRAVQTLTINSIGDLTAQLDAMRRLIAGLDTRGIRPYADNPSPMSWVLFGLDGIDKLQRAAGERAKVMDLAVVAGHLHEHACTVGCRLASGGECNADGLTDADRTAAVRLLHDLDPTRAERTTSA